MKFVCTQENLSQGLSAVSHITSKSINLPILGNVLLKTDGGNLTLSATNLELAVSTVVRGKTESVGEYTVPAKLFHDFVSLLPQGKVELELEEEGLKVNASGQETIIRGMDAVEFPLIPKLSKNVGVQIKSEDLRKALSQVVFSVSHSESRPELSGVACWFGGEIGEKKIAFVATDGYRLAERVIQVDQDIPTQRIIVPSRTILEIGRILSSYKDELGVPERVEWLMTENQLVISYGNTELISRLIEGAFPDYQQIIPNHFKTTAVLDRLDFQKAVKTASLFSRQGLFDVHLECKPEEGLISVHSADQGTGKTFSAVQGELEGEEIKLTVNFKYLNDGLAAMGTAKVQLHLIDSMSAMVILPEGGADAYRYLIMPIRQ